MANKREGDFILNNYDKDTGLPFNSKIISEFPDGTPITDSDVDNKVLLKNSSRNGGGYSVRAFDVGQSKTLVVDNVEAIRNLSKSNILMFRLGVYTNIRTEGYYEPNDGGGFEYLYNPTSVVDDDGFLFIKSNRSGAGRFVPIIKDKVNVRIAGAKGDGISDDTVYIQKAIDFVSDTNKGEVVLPREATIVVSKQGELSFKSWANGNNLTQSYALLIKDGVVVNLNGSTIKLLDNQNCSIFSNDRYDFDLAPNVNFKIYNGFLNGNKHNQQRVSGGTYISPIAIQNAKFISFDLITFDDVYESSVRLIGVDFLNIGSLHTSYSEGDAYRLGGYTPTQVYEGRVRYASIGTLTADNCQNGLIGTLQGNPVVAAISYSSINSIQANKCGGGFKFQEGCEFVNIGQSLFIGAKGEEVTTSNATGNSGLKIQGGAFLEHSPKFITVGEVISENAQGNGLYLEYCDDVSVGSYIGKNNCAGGTQSCVRVGNGKRNKVGSINSVNSGAFGLHLRADAFDTLIGDVTILNPSTLATDQSGIQILGGSHRLGKCIIKDDRVVTRMNFAIDIAGASSVGNIDMLDCLGYKNNPTRENSPSFVINRKIINGEDINYCKSIVISDKIESGSSTPLNSNIAVRGRSGSGAGVRGDSMSYIGVQGTSVEGIAGNFSQTTSPEKALISPALRVARQYTSQGGFGVTAPLVFLNDSVSTTGTRNNDLVQIAWDGILKFVVDKSGYITTGGVKPAPPVPNITTSAVTTIEEANTQIEALSTKLNDLLTAMRTAGMITP